MCWLVVLHDKGHGVWSNFSRYDEQLVSLCCLDYNFLDEKTFGVVKARQTKLLRHYQSVVHLWKRVSLVSSFLTHSFQIVGNWLVFSAETRSSDILPFQDVERCCLAVVGELFQEVSE